MLVLSGSNEIVGFCVSSVLHDSDGLGLRLLLILLPWLYLVLFGKSVGCSFRLGWEVFFLPGASDLSVGRKQLESASFQMDLFFRDARRRETGLQGLGQVGISRVARVMCVGYFSVVRC